MRALWNVTSEGGITLVELMIALVVLSVGLLAVGQMFPAGSRSQNQNRMRSTANYYSQEKIEELSTLQWTDNNLTAGRHPAGSACDTLGTYGTWLRFYQVDVLPIPLDNLKRVAVNVSWRYQGVTRTVTDTAYVRR